MKTLILIFIIFILNCGQSPNELEKEKGLESSVLLPVADYYRSIRLSDDEKAAIANAQKIAAIQSLPLIDAATMTSAQITNLSLDGVVVSAEIPSNGRPFIKFYVATKTTATLAASRVKGFSWKTTSTTPPSGTRFASGLTTINNINFTIAKYVEGTNGAPGKWVNYIVTTPEITAGTDGTSTYIRPHSFSIPTNDNEGTLVDLGDGSYTYRFSRDITDVATWVGKTYNETRTTLYTKTSVLVDQSPTKVANLGDLTYNPNLPHRIVVYIGTGSNGGLNFQDGETLAYDFIPSTRQVKAPQRDITSTKTCNDNCHKLPPYQADGVTPNPTTGIISTRGLVFHGSGGRNDVRHCVMCHTDQLRASSDVNVISVNGVYSAPTPAEYYVLDGYNIVDFPIMVHKFHMSSWLTKSGNYYAVNSSYNFKTKAAAFISLADARLCYNCHTTNKSALQEDNWKTKPSIAACGSCHDGVDFKTGLMFKSVKIGVTDVTHGGGKQLDDSQCAGCHTSTDIIKKHRLE